MSVTGKRARTENDNEMEKMWEKLWDARNDSKHARLWERILEDVESIFQDKEDDSFKEKEDEKGNEDDSFENLVEMSKDYGGCCYLRAKVANEGSSYFYNDYTYVPASWGTFSEYCDYEEGDCWCGACPKGCSCLNKK